MKKLFAAALVVSMLTVLLSGCMCQVADTTFQFDGSGTVEPNSASPRKWSTR